MYDISLQYLSLASFPEWLSLIWKEQRPAFMSALDTMTGYNASDSNTNNTSILQHNTTNNTNARNTTNS